VLGHQFYRLLDLGAVPRLAIPMLRAGEVLTLAAAVATFWAWGLPQRHRIGWLALAGVVAVMLVLWLAALSPASAVAILALWTTGLSLILPFPIYLLALGLYLLAAVACWRSPDGFWTAAGLLLVLLAGYMAESTYHHLLLLLGILLLSGALLRAPSPDDSPA
jgi:hypothetical protein